MDAHVPSDKIWAAVVIGTQLIRRPCACHVRRGSVVGWGGVGWGCSYTVIRTSLCFTLCITTYFFQSHLLLCNIQVYCKYHNDLQVEGRALFCRLFKWKKSVLSWTIINERTLGWTFGWPQITYHQTFKNTVPNCSLTLLSETLDTSIFLGKTWVYNLMHRQRHC